MSRARLNVDIKADAVDYQIAVFQINRVGFGNRVVSHGAALHLKRAFSGQNQIARNINISINRVERNSPGENAGVMACKDAVIALQFDGEGGIRPGVGHNG